MKPTETALLFILKPLVAFVILLVVALIARLVLRFIPEGKAKRLLTRRVGP
jgi:hypothetical protein